jgi:four helix bundle protein
MSIQSERLKQRSFQFAVSVLDLVDRFPQKTSGFVVGRQLAKAATSVAANYRATCVARSRSEFIAKLGVVFEESDESEFWLHIAVLRQMGDAAKAKQLRAEAVELRAIFGRSVGTARANAK